MKHFPLALFSSRHRLLAVLTLLGAASPSTPASAAEPLVVLRGASLIDGTGSPRQDGVDILLEGATIKGVSSGGTAAVPEGAPIVDCRGKTIIPGLISAHAHLGQTAGSRSGSDYYTRDNIARQLRQYEAYGEVVQVSRTGLCLVLEGEFEVGG